MSIVQRLRYTVEEGGDWTEVWVHSLEMPDGRQWDVRNGWRRNVEVAVANKERVLRDTWAREHGYNDFDAYLATGGSLSDAVVTIAGEIGKLQQTQMAIQLLIVGERDAAVTSAAAIEGAE